MEVGDNPSYHHYAVGEFRVSEEDEGEHGEVEGDDTCHYAAEASRTVVLAVAHHVSPPPFMHGLCHAVQSSPYYEVEARPVPQTSQQHGYDEVDVCAQLAPAAASKRYVHVVSYPCGERYVPSSPEVGDACAEEWDVEVLREVEAQQQRQTYGHVAVTAEVAVYLKGVPISPEQILETTVQQGRVEHTVYEVDAYIVAYHGFLE